MTRWLAALLALFGIGCGLTYQDEVRRSGLTNYHAIIPQGRGVGTDDPPGIHRVAIPTSEAAVQDLVALVEEPGRNVVRLSLHDAAEGDESWVEQVGWQLVSIPLFPEDDKPWTVLERPSAADVYRARNVVLEAHARGDVVVFGCVHDRERGGLVAALVGMALFGWSKREALDYQVATGSRIEWTPGLRAFFDDEVR